MEALINLERVSGGYVSQVVRDGVDCWQAYDERVCRILYPMRTREEAIAKVRRLKEHPEQFRTFFRVITLYTGGGSSYVEFSDYRSAREHQLFGRGKDGFTKLETLIFDASELFDVERLPE